MATHCEQGQSRGPSGAPGTSMQTETAKGKDNSWLVVDQSEGGALVDGIELDVDDVSVLVNDGPSGGEGGSTVTELFPSAVENRESDEAVQSDGRQCDDREEEQGGGGEEQQDGGGEGVVPNPKNSENTAAQQVSEAAAAPAVTEYEVGDLVEVQKYGHGVVQWVGEVGGQRMAGIELEDYREGCGNGCLPGDTVSLFSCEPGHGVFSLITDLSPDKRFTEQLSPGPQDSASWRSGLFEPGSMVEVKDYGFGVVQWLGELGGIETAGIELEEHREQCGDGTPEGGDRVLFQCQPGHALFSPMTDLLPDSRFTATETVNPLHEVPMETVDEGIAIPLPGHYCRGRQWGIQGEHNSCYLDATLFGLFALSSEFDTLLISHRGGPKGEEICNTLRTQIINPLRKNGVLRCEPVLHLRERLDKLGKLRGLRQEEKDPEEFLNMLFKHALATSPFISIQRPQGEEGEFFVQLFMEADPTLKLPTIHDLLAKMFREQDIKFSEIPQKLLIQVPRYGKQFKTFQLIIPDKRLNIRELCTGKSLSHRIGEVNAHLQLLSVICIETSHYVCFTRSEQRWIFMDSMADRVDDRFNIPSCDDCTDLLEEWVYSEQCWKELKKQPAATKLPDLVRRFTQDVYMCVYVEDSTAV